MSRSKFEATDSCLARDFEATYSFSTRDFEATDSCSAEFLNKRFISSSKI
jgi:hypothetical protein